ncbi:MAG: filamentous hemagglutinin N-terminal domain-containing protein [Alphaproteobacteria bacterium]
MSLWRALMLASVLPTGLAWALPQQAQVVAGQATLSQPDASTLTITQNTNRAILNWDAFNIGTGESVYFALPNAGSISLNRVVGGSASSILGSLGSNGSVYLLNPQGIMFGAGAQVNVGSLLASTATLTDSAFMAGGPMAFSGGQGNVTNHGILTIAPHGYAVLAAPTVENTGNIHAPQGTVALAGAGAFTVDPVGDNLLTLSPNPMGFAAHVANTGSLSANGGTVALTTQATEAALANVVNTSGLIEANSFETVNGHIVLGSAPTQMTQVAGTVTADGTTPNATGGVVDVVGQFVDVQTGARLAADGPAGGGAVHVGGLAHGATGLPTAQHTRVASGAVLSANATQNGKGGEVTVWANGTTRFAGTNQARGGAQGGDGGFLEISGVQGLAFNGHADTTAAHGHTGTLLFDPTNIVITDGGPDADDAEVADGTVLGADGGLVDFAISEQALEVLSAGTNIDLRATNNFTVANLTDDTLSLASTGNVNFMADSDADGSGSFSMDTGDTIDTVGADLTLNGVTILLGTLNTAGGSGGDINLTTTGGTGVVNMNRNITTNGGAITVNGNTTLGTDIGLATGSGGAIALNGTVTGATELLALTAGTGNITLGGNVTLDDLQFISGNNLTLGGIWAVASALDFTPLSALTLTANTTLNANGGASNITFDSGNSINGARTLTLTGDVLTLPVMGNLTPLTTVTANGATSLSLDDVTTTGNQTYTAPALNIAAGLTSSGGDLQFNNPITLTANSSFQGGAITAANTINGAHNLIINGTGATDFQGVVGGVTPLASLAVTAGTLTSRGATTTGAQTFTGATTLQGVTTHTGSALTFNSPVTMNGTANINTTGGDATFASTLNGSSPLIASTGTGQLRLQGAVGGVTPLSGITNSGASTITGNATTSGNQTYGTLNLGSTLTLSGGVFSAGDVALTTSAAINTSAGNGNISINGLLSGAHTLTLNAGTSGDILLADDATIGAFAFAGGDALTLGGNLTTTGAMDFTGLNGITLTANSAWDAGTANITMDSGNTLTGAFNIAMSGGTLTTGPISGVNTLTLTASTASNVARAISTGGTQTYNGPTNLGTTLTTTGDAVTLNGTTTLTANSTITTAGGAFDINSTLNGPYSLTVNTGAADITVGSSLGGITPLTDLTFTTTGDFVANALNQTGDLVVNATTLTFNQALAADDITLTGDTHVLNTITAAGTLSMTGDNILDAVLTSVGAMMLTGNNTVNAALTSSAALSLVGDNTVNDTLTAGTNLTITGDTTLNGNLTAGDDLTVTGATTLAANTTLTSGGGSGDTLTHTGAITGDHNVTLVAGSGDIDMTGNMDVNALTISSGRDFIYGGGNIEADSGLTFSPVQRILLGGDTNVYGRDGTTRTNVAMGTTNQILATTSGVDLLIYGNLVTLYQVGNTTTGKLATLTIDASVAQILGNIYTTGAQTITADQGLAGFLSSGGGDISLNTAANLVGDIFITTDGGDIFINQALNGPYAMNLDAGLGEVFINAPLGNTSALTNMTIAAQIINLTSPITTTGAQTYTGETNLNNLLTIGYGDITYNNAVNLGGNGAIDTSGGNGTITFNDTVDGPYHLTLRAGSQGNILFNGPVGATTRVGSITVESTENITFDYGLYAENYYQNRINGLADFGFSPGLNVTNGIYVATSRDLVGRYTGRDVNLEADGLISGEVYAANTLNLTSARTLLNGSIQGMVGRDAARLITFSHFNGGPHYFASMNLPLVDDFYATPAAMSGAPLATTLNLPAQASTALNPFTALPPLVLAENGVVDDSADDVFGGWLGM